MCWGMVSLLVRIEGTWYYAAMKFYFFSIRHVVVKEDLSEFFNDGSWRRGYKVNR